MTDPGLPQPTGGSSGKSRTRWVGANPATVDSGVMPPTGSTYSPRRLARSNPRVGNAQRTGAGPGFRWQQWSRNRRACPAHPSRRPSQRHRRWH